MSGPEFCPKIEHGIRHLLSSVNSGNPDYTSVLIALHLVSCDRCGRKLYKIVNGRFLVKFDFHLSLVETDDCSCELCRQWRQVLREPEKFRMSMLVDKTPKFLKTEKETEDREETGISRSPASAAPTKKQPQTWKAPKDYNAETFELDTEIPGLKYQLIDFLSDHDLNYIVDFDVEADMGNAELRVRISCPRDAIEPILAQFAHDNGFKKMTWSDRGFYILKRRWGS